jgi:hypothetical protein
MALFLKMLLGCELISCSLFVPHSKKGPGIEARFKIGSWHKGWQVDREIAIVDHVALARAALYDAAMRELPDKWITLRQDARVIRENKPTMDKR